MKFYFVFDESQFEGLKLKKAGILPWKNQKECEKYFDEKLNEDNEFNRLALKNTVIRDYKEDLHIAASKWFIFRSIAQFIIGIALLMAMSHSFTLSFILLGLSLISMFISFFYKKGFKNIVFSLNQIDTMIEILFYINGKKKITEIIFREQNDHNPIPFGKIPFPLEPNDIINAGHDEGFYSENDSWDPHFYLEVNRERLETDEEFEKRKEEEEKSAKYMHERRYQSYLRLKKEFEGDDSK